MQKYLPRECKLHGSNWTSARNKRPAFLLSAMNAIQPLRWNVSAVEVYMNKLKVLAEQEAHTKTSKAWFRYGYAQNWYSEMKESSISTEGNIASTPVSMGICKTGRLKETGFGLLGAWDEFRYIALSGIEYTNSDIVSCHLNLLQELLAEKIEGLADFASKSKHDHIAELEIDVLCREYLSRHPTVDADEYNPEKIWKELMYSYDFGYLKWPTLTV